MVVDQILCDKFDANTQGDYDATSFWNEIAPFKGQNKS
jgi:hypothetical protein